MLDKVIIKEKTKSFRVYYDMDNKIIFANLCCLIFWYRSMGNDRSCQGCIRARRCPSFMKAVGLQVTDEIGYSEVAGLYGGINMVIGLLCFLALFSRGITLYVLSLLAFLTFSIALGRYLFSLIPMYFAASGLPPSEYRFLPKRV